VFGWTILLFYSNKVREVHCTYKLTCRFSESAWLHTNDLKIAIGDRTMFALHHDWPHWRLVVKWGRASRAGDFNVFVNELAIVKHYNELGVLCSIAGCAERGARNVMSKLCHYPGGSINATFGAFGHVEPDMNLGVVILGVVDNIFRLGSWIACSRKARIPFHDLTLNNR